MKHPKAKPKKAKSSKKPAKPEVPAVQVQTPIERPGSITVTFTGDPNSTSNPAVLQYRGKDFPLGEPVVIDDARWLERHGDRVRANRHFKVEG